ncbi:MAG: RNA-binding domain-containing protein [Bacteroidia bacterium]
MEKYKTIHLLQKSTCMALPVKIDELINGHVVEWARLEFKESWNPQDVMHSMCAFANDIDNWGGGYIIIGIEEKDGAIVLPPKGLNLNQIDKIQRELLGLSHKITPNYFPVVFPEIYDGKHVLIIWAPGGETRPYSAPVSLVKDEKQRAYYIRRYSSTVKAKRADEETLMSLAAKVPHDDRINHNAEISDLDLGLIQGFLYEVGSGLYEQTKKIPFNDLCRQMQIARGSKEFFKPVNVGLLFFSEHPEKFFPGARIEVVIFHDDVGDKMTEKIFKGPLHIQLRNALEFINNNAIVEHVMKVPRQAEAIRFYDYPYEAVKEALANAIYHRSYEDRAPIVVTIRNHQMAIHSIPGPIPPIDNKALAKERVSAGMYRNRRIGDFLKELHLTEGRETGFPKIRRAMKANGSPAPTFKTDKGRTHFITILPERQLSDKEKAAIAVGEKKVEKKWVEVSEELLDIDDRLDRAIKEYGAKHRDIAGDRGRDIAGAIFGDMDIDTVRDIAFDAQNDIGGRQEEILLYCATGRTRKEILRKIKLVSNVKNYNTYVAPLIQMGWLEMTIPNKPSSPKQRYRTALKGQLIFHFMNYVDEHGY